MSGKTMTHYDYQVIGSDGKLHNYIWDDKQSKMVEGKREKSVPWWRLHRIAEELGGELKSYIIQDSRGNVTRKISIEYKEEE
jgi:hypothetical protein